MGSLMSTEPSTTEGLLQHAPMAYGASPQRKLRYVSPNRALHEPHTQFSTALVLTRLRMQLPRRHASQARTQRVPDNVLRCPMCVAHLQCTLDSQVPVNWLNGSTDDAE